MTNKSKKIVAEISAGELFDKVTILQIKSKKISEKASLEEVNKELNLLENTRLELLNSNKDNEERLIREFEKLKDINLSLWDIEDKIRICEKNKNFGKEFIELARLVYIKNDERAKIKLEINIKTGSKIKEIKEYTNY